MSTAELFPRLLRPLWTTPPRVFAGHFHEGNHDSRIASKTAQRNLPVHDNGDPKAVVILRAKVFSQRDPTSLTGGSTVYGTRPGDTSRFSYGGVYPAVRVPNTDASRRPQGDGLVVVIGG